MIIITVNDSDTSEPVHTVVAQASSKTWDRPENFGRDEGAVFFMDWDAAHLIVEAQSKPDAALSVEAVLDLMRQNLGWQVFVCSTVDVGL